MTKTVLLSRHGAGIISTYKLSAEQEIIIRYLDTNKEALVRVVGRIGSEGEIYTYGVAFVDTSQIDFWGIDFAPVSEKDKQARRVLLECGSCKQRETVDHSDVESDVLIINEGIVRYCKSAETQPCGNAPEAADEPTVLVAAGRDTTIASSAQSTTAASKQFALPAQTASTLTTPQNLTPHRCVIGQPPQIRTYQGQLQSLRPAVWLCGRRRHLRRHVQGRNLFQEPEAVFCAEQHRSRRSLFSWRQRHFCPGGNRLGS